jgi:hypothetical protein
MDRINFNIYITQYIQNSIILTFTQYKNINETIYIFSKYRNLGECYS